jgi:glycosyltransferase involved in cell wall biosynthesis
VTYDNTSSAEVAGPNCVLVPNRWEDLAHGIETILDRDPATKAVDADEGRAWAATFTWDTLGEVLDREVGAALGRPIAR